MNPVSGCSWRSTSNRIQKQNSATPCAQIVCESLILPISRRMHECEDPQATILRKSGGHGSASNSSRRNTSRGRGQQLCLTASRATAHEAYLRRGKGNCRRILRAEGGGCLRDDLWLVRNPGPSRRRPASIGYW